MTSRSASRPDYSVLRPSIQVNVSGVKETLRAVKCGSKEVQEALLNECNVIYECKVCFNMFRTVANLVAHKRSFCRNRIRNTCHVKPPDPSKPQRSQKVALVQPEPVETVLPEEPFDLDEYSPSIELLKEAGILAEIEHRPLVPSLMPPEPHKSKLSSIVERLRKIQDEREDEGDDSIVLEPIVQSSRAVFQTYGHRYGEQTAGQKYVDLQKALRLGTAFVGPDNVEISPGPSSRSFSPAPSNDSRSNPTQYPCFKCSATYSKIHFAVKHLEKRHGFSEKQAQMARSKLILMSKIDTRRRAQVRLRRLSQAEIYRWTSKNSTTITNKGDTSPMFNDENLPETAAAQDVLRKSGKVPLLPSVKLTPLETSLVNWSTGEVEGCDVQASSRGNGKFSPAQSGKDGDFCFQKAALESVTNLVSVAIQRLPEAKYFPAKARAERERSLENPSKRWRRSVSREKFPVKGEDTDEEVTLNVDVKDGEISPRSKGKRTRKVARLLNDLERPRDVLGNSKMAMRKNSVAVLKSRDDRNIHNGVKSCADGKDKKSP